MTSNMSHGAAGLLLLRGRLRAPPRQLYRGPCRLQASRLDPSLEINVFPFQKPLVIFLYPLDFGS